MPKNLIDKNTGKQLQQLTDQQLQDMQDLVDQGQLFGQGLATAQSILQSTNQDIQITKSEYADILSILQQTLNISQGIGFTIGSTVQQLQSISTVLSRNVSSLIKGDDILKNVLRSTYQLQNVADKIQTVRINGDLWQIKDLTKANQEITRIEQSLRRQGGRFGYSDGELADPTVRGNILKESRKQATIDSLVVKELKTALSKNGQFTFKSGKLGNLDTDAPEVKAILDKYGGKASKKTGNYNLDLNPLSTRNLQNLFKELSSLDTELKEIQTIISDLNESEKIRKENLKEYQTTLDTKKAVGSSAGRANILAKLASKAGLSTTSDLIKDSNELAVKAAKQHLTTNPRDFDGAKKVYDQIFKVKDVMQMVKSDAAETYLHLGKWGGPLGAILAAASAIFGYFLKTSGETAHVKQLVGEWTMGLAGANFGQASILETTKLIGELTEKISLNPIAVFDQYELGRMSEAKKLLGLTADQAAGLGVQSKLNRQTADEYRKSLQRGIGTGQILNKTVISQGVATREALAASDAIKVSMGNNAEAIGRAVVAAKALGLSLQDAENIANSLINFESSIESEMQAQLLTGHQLNLAKAREYALNNDLEGVMREIGRQGITMAEFGRMGRIAQENLAKALGMSREQMAKMVATQALSEGFSAKQIAAAGVMNEKQIEAISLQENWQAMLSRLMGALTPILQVLLPIVELASKIVGILTGAVTWILEPLDKLATHLSSVIGKWSDWGSIVRKHGKNTKGSLDSISASTVELGTKGKSTFASLGQGAGSFLLVSSLLGMTLPKITRGFVSMGSGGMKAIRSLIGGFKNMILAGKGATNWIRGTIAGKNTLKGSILRTAGAQQLYRSTGGAGKNVGKAVSGTAAAKAAGSTAQTVKGKGSNLPVLGNSIARFFRAFNKVTAGQIGKAVLAGLALVPVALASPAIAIASLVGPLARKGLPALGQGIAGFFRALSRSGSAIIEGSLYLAVFGAALIPLTFALRLAAPAFEAFAKVISGLGFAIREAFSGIAEMISSVFTGITGMLSEITIEKAAALVAVGGGFGALALGIGAATAALALFPVGKLGKALAVASAHRQQNASPAVSEKSSENTGESKEIKRETIEAAAQSIVIKQAQVQASAQQISVEQKATDLSKIEQKIDRVVTAIRQATPSDWNWLEFNRAYEANT